MPAYGEPNIYSTGHVTQGEAGTTRARLGDFNDKVEAGQYDCSSCRMLPVCGGACPKEWLEGHKPCPSAKQNMPDRPCWRSRQPRMAEAAPSRRHSAAVLDIALDRIRLERDG